ncbi:MAG: nucleoside-diphosphate kinase [bacterium]
MAIERTFSIVKPDAVAKHGIGKVIARIEEGGLKVLAGRYLQMSTEQAKTFYAVHKERPFYGELVTFMTSGPVFVSVLEGENAITRYREVLGATNPAEAEAGTVRALYGTDIEKNAAHGSDAAETAKEEIAFFFQDSDIIS